MRGQYQGMERKCNEDDNWGTLMRRWKKIILLLNSVFKIILRIATYLTADTFPGPFSLDYSRNSETIWKAMECCHKVSVFYPAPSCTTSSRNVYLHVLGIPFFAKTDGEHRLCYVQKWSYCAQQTCHMKCRWTAGLQCWLFQVQPNLWQMSPNLWVLFEDTIWMPVFSSPLRLI